MEDKKTSSLKRLFQLLEKHKYIYIFSVVICAMTHPLYQIGYAFVNKSIVNGIEFHDSQLFINGLIAMGIILLIYVTVQPVTGYYYEIGVYKPTILIERRLLSNVIQLPMDFFYKTHSSDILTRITSDIAILSRFYKESTYDITYQTFYGIGAFVSLIILEIRFLPILLIGGLTSYLASYWFSKKTFVTGQRLQKNISKANEFISDLLTGMMIIKIYNAQRMLSKRYNKINDDVADSKTAFHRVTRQKNVLDSIIEMMVLVVVLTYGIFLYAKGTISLGTLVAVMALQNGVVRVFVEWGDYIKNYKEALVGGMRIFDFMDIKKENGLESPKIDINNLPKDKGIVFQNVSFNYTEGSNIPVLVDVDLFMENQAVTAVTGSSGSGKSTLMKLLLGFHKPDSGTIKLFGINICDMETSQLRELISYIPQNPILFQNTTIHDNILCGKRDISDEMLHHAAQFAGAHDFIMQTPNGYNTLIGPDGIQLSSGQQQRIALARAFLKDAPIFILDEVTSALDPETEAIINKSIIKLRSNKLVIIIAHRATSISCADKILNLEKKHIA